jgi:hypothetical protein
MPTDVARRLRLERFPERAREIVLAEVLAPPLARRKQPGRDFVSALAVARALYRGASSGGAAPSDASGAGST